MKERAREEQMEMKDGGIFFVGPRWRLNDCRRRDWEDQRKPWGPEEVGCVGFRKARGRRRAIRDLGARPDSRGAR